MEEADASSTRASGGGRSAAPASVSAGATASSPSAVGGRRRRGGGKRKRGAMRQQPRDRANGDNEGDDEQKPPPEEKKAETDTEQTANPSQWACPACTFLNDAARCLCEMCGTSNPTPSARKPSGSRGFGDAAAEMTLTAPEWSCAACTMVNPAAMRMCGVCGTLNPHPALPGALTIARRSHSSALGLGGDSEDDSMDDGDDDEDKDEDSDDVEDEKDEVWTCPSCELAATGSSCPHCYVLRQKKPRVAGTGETTSQHAVALQEKQKRCKREKKRAARNKMAYGVSIYGLKKLALEPTSTRLLDTLQTLTHTLAMMDASADSEWGDVHGSSLFLRGFGGPGLSSSAGTAKDPELLTVLTSIFRGAERDYPKEVRLLAVQSVNYLMKMDRHMFARSELQGIVALYIAELLAWKTATTSSDEGGTSSRNAQMIVEECLSGLSSMCSSEAFALHEVLAPGNFAGYLDFLSTLVAEDSENANGFHPSIVVTALGILQKCCMKLRWSVKPAGGQNPRSTAESSSTRSQASSSASPKKAKQDAKLTLALAAKLTKILRRVLEHKHVPLHVNAAKCLLLMFHRTPYDHPEVIGELVTPEALRKFVAVVVNASGAESEDSRHAMISLLLHLFDNRPQLVTVFVQESIYSELFRGMLPLLESSSTALGASALKLMGLLTRVVCSKHSSLSSVASGKPVPVYPRSSGPSSPRGRRNRVRLNSLPDPDVLSTLLLDFIRADSIPAVSALLKDGADLNFPKIHDIHGKEIDKPLQVAAEHASLGMVRFLVKRGADVHQVGSNGTALHIAARTGRCDVAAFLLQCGASVSDKNRERKTVLQVVESADEEVAGGDKMGATPSPMKKLLELYQGVTGLRDDDSELSEMEDGISRGRSRTWFFSPDQDEYGGGMDDMDENDLDEDEEGYYMDYDEVDDEMEDEEISSDEEMNDYDGDMQETDGGCGSSGVARARRLGSISSESETKTEEPCQHDASSSATHAPRGRTSSDGDKTVKGEDIAFRHQGFTATADEIYNFSLAMVECLLAVLYQMDIQNVERAVISTLACVLEMAPSQLIRSLKETDVVLILDTVHFLLQGEKQPDTSGGSTSGQPNSKLGGLPGSRNSRAGDTTLSAAQKSNISSFILALRILQAVIRKSSADSSIFYQIERRGITEQIQQLNDSSASWMSAGQDGTPSHGPRDTIFGRGLALLETLRSDMLESGMMYLHKLKNLARRLKDFSEEASLPSEKNLVLVDLVDLFEQQNSITTYEFKQSELLPAILHFLSPQGKLDDGRVKALMCAFEHCPSALKHLLFRLQSIITQEESFPLVSFNSGKGRELYPLTKQLKISFMRPGDRNFADRESGSSSAVRPKAKAIHSSPLTPFQSFERTVSRCLPVIDADLSLLYLNLVGHRIQKVVEGKWRKFLVVGYDDTRSIHLVKPVGGSDDDLVEVVVHDSQCKLLGRVDVYENVALDLEMFGVPVNSGYDANIDGKKKRKNNKRKRKLPSPKHQESEGVCQVEVLNRDALGIHKLKGAWFAGVLMNSDGVEPLRADAGAQQTFDEIVGAKSLHSVKLLPGNRVVHKVPADCLRARPAHPQIGSVVEVDGSLGEVTRVYGDERTSGATSNGSNKLLDVRINADIEKIRVKKDRVRFPPHQLSASPIFGEESDRIEAMSLRRLFPARDSSVLVGSVGDRVWVLPCAGSSVKDLCVAGTVKSFPSGLESIRESSTVAIELCFGSSQPPMTVKVHQDRVLNLGTGGSGRSGSGSSRLLAALQMASGRGGHNRLFGSGQLDSSTSAIHRAFGRVAGSLEHNRFGGGLGSSSNTMDQIRQLLSRGSSTGGPFSANDTEASEQDIASNSRNPSTSSPPNEQTSDAAAALTGEEIEAESNATSVPPSPTATKQQTTSNREKRQGSGGNYGELDDSVVRAFVKTEGRKPKWICSELPKVGLVVGFRKCDVASSASDRIYVASEFGMEVADRKKPSEDTTVSTLIKLNAATQRYEAKPGARRCLVEVFHSFDASARPKPSPKRKKRKLQAASPRRTTADPAPWDIEKFVAFMSAALGLPKQASSRPQSSVSYKYCILFSKFATPASNRRLLTVDGFVALMVHVCNDASKVKPLLKYLRSRGYSERTLTADTDPSNDDDEEEEKAAHATGDEGSEATQTTPELYGSRMLRQPVVLRGFPADQNVLKCVEELRQQHRGPSGNAVLANGSASASGQTALPPWKLTYKLYCDFHVEWPSQSSSNKDTSDTAAAEADPLETLATLESRPPMLLSSHGTTILGGMNADAATEASRWLARVSTKSNGYGGSNCGDAIVPKSVASAVGLLRYLFEFRSDTAADEALWTSPRLYNKLETQMQDVLSMCSGIYPPWCDALVTHCKFFFPRELREKLFRATSFGCTRSLHWFRNQFNLDESGLGGNDGVSSIPVGGGILNQEISISPIPKERVKVHRANILQSAEAVMKMHAKRKAILDLVFVGEKGYGSGVTAAFYSTTAHALQSLKENKKSKYWIPGEDDDVMTTEATEHHVRELNEADSIMDDDPVIRHANGLFPFPHRAPSAKLVDRFRMIGRLAGKALMDERLLPLPLSPQFMKLVLGEGVALQELEDIFLSHGRILYSMHKASQKLIAGEQDVEIDHMGVSDWLEAVGLTFIDPFTQEPLIVDGENTEVTVASLQKYVEVVLNLWLNKGVRAQVVAFREGINEVLPLAKLRLLFVPELLAMLCGDDDIQWDAESLLKDTKLAHGYTKDSLPVQYFLEVLEEMTVEQRRAFLLYATGCPNLPPGGFQALKPPFEVVRRVVDNDDVDRSLPFARTCTNTLHLPAYSSKRVLKDQMIFAIANSRGVIDRD